MRMATTVKVKSPTIPAATHSDFDMPRIDAEGKLIDKRNRPIESGVVQRWHSDVEIELALQKARGFRSVAAQELGMSINGLNKRIRQSEDLKQLLRDIENFWLDKTEQKLFEAIERGDLAAICFHLKHKGRARGYGEWREQLLGIAIGEFDEVTKPPDLVLKFVDAVNPNAPSGTTADPDAALGAAEGTR
jgi:hypothetical protein